MAKKTCKFFALGSCARGQACLYSHEVSSSGSLRPGASPLSPAPLITTSSVAPAEKKRIPCHFYLVGCCNKGNNCPYKHSDENKSTANNEAKMQPEFFRDEPRMQPELTETKISPIAASEHFNEKLEVRDLQGASVMFGPGAQVQDLEFPSDYSAVQLTSPQPNCDAANFQRFMAMLGETVPLSSIRVKAVMKPPSTVATARNRDSGFGLRLRSKAGTGAEGMDVSDISVSILQVETKSDSSANRLQMSTISCTWYKPSRIAWLHYTNIRKARTAERFITSRNFNIEGRKIQATLQIPEQRNELTIYSVQLGNLQAFTSQAKIERHMSSHITPINVVMGKISYSMSLHEAEKCVKDLLDGVAPLELWEPNFTASATLVKAVARFLTREDARKAVDLLNGMKVPQFANSKLFVSPLISVKFNVPKAMYRAIRKDIDHLKDQLWATDNLHIKSYPPADPRQKLITLRIYGEDAKAVARLKSALEKILAGDVAMNGDLGIWAEFFANSQGLTWLNELGFTHQGYIYRDMRKHRLSIYGSANSKANIRKALIEKIRSLTETTHYILLSAEDFKKALHGGFRRIVAALGKQNASLDPRTKPQIITITGSVHDLKTAQTFLDEDVATKLENLALGENTDQPDCVVCWTEAEDIYHTPCGHVYCRKCFSNQCSSAGEGDLPICCFGDSGNCLQVLGIQEIRTAIPPEAFEQLLEDSFALHIRTNPQSYQYCPTPDCQQIYRVSPNGVIFTCPACLTPICTTCQITSHDDMTCENFKHIEMESDEEFRKWKQENNVKDCPLCKVPIEKAYGCNHMECSNCQTHICWVCLETFNEGGKCYAHMLEVHESFYDGGDQVDW